MVSRVVRSKGIWLAAALVAPAALLAGQGSYTLGEVSQEDILTPVPLEVVDPEATEALKRKEAEKVPLVFRFNTQSADEAEAALRSAFAAAKSNFLAALRRTMKDRPLNDRDSGSSLFDRAVESARKQMNGFPLLDDLAPVWSRNGSDEEIQEQMVGMLRKVLSSPVLAQKVDGFKAQDAAWLVPVNSLNAVPTPAMAEKRHTTLMASQVTLLPQARSFVRSNLPPELAIGSAYLALFVRPNAQLDEDLVERIRQERTALLAVLDKYDAGQLVVHRGQIIDRKALAALAALQEKTTIGNLQEKIAQEQRVAAESRRQVAWAIAIGTFVISLLGTAIWWMRFQKGRPHPSTRASVTVPATIAEDAWRTRALVAESRADRAQEALRSGMLQWMQDRFVRGLFQQRGELLTAQQKAEMEMRQLEQRLEQLQTPLQERIAAYEQRIVELERDLAAKGEENRDLIRARISLVRHQLAQERSRAGAFGTN